MFKISFMLIVSFSLLSCRLEKDSLQTWTIKKIKPNGIVKFKNHEGRFRMSGLDTLKVGDNIEVMVNATAPHTEDIVRVDTMHLRRRIVHKPKL